jgi:terminase small subunit / prophage DNA-packing protein
MQGGEMRIVSEVRADTDAPVHLIDSAGLCELLSINAPTLTQLKQRAIAVPAGRATWDLCATVNNYVVNLRGTASGRGGEEHVANLTAERARLARAQAEAQEMKNAVARGELLDADEVTRAWSDVLRQVRAQVLAVPSRVRQAMNLDGASTEVIDREVRAALERLGTQQD